MLFVSKVVDNSVYVTDTKDNVEERVTMQDICILYKKGIKDNEKTISYRCLRHDLPCILRTDQSAANQQQRHEYKRRDGLRKHSTRNYK